MKAIIEIFSDLEEKKHSLVFIRKREFETEQEINDFANSVMDSFEKIYEEKISMTAYIKIEPYHIKRNGE